MSVVLEVMTEIRHSLPSPDADLPADAVSTIEELRQLRQLARWAEARQLALAATFADTNSTLDAPSPALPGAERLVASGSDGTPEIAEFSTLELAAALQLRELDAEVLVSNAVDLRHRTPRLWAATMAGELDVWRARGLVGELSSLDADDARLVDAELAPRAQTMPWGRLKRLAQGLVLAHTPEPQAEQMRQAALERRGVWVAQSQHGTTEVQATLDAGDALVLGATVDRLAGILAEGSVVGTPDARRAMALGLLGTPARALNLLQASLLEQLPEVPDEFEQCTMAGTPGHTCGRVTVDPEALLPRAELVVHLTDLTLADGAGPVRSRTVGPLLAEWAAQLLGHHRVAIRPVIDANNMVASDSYECPAAMRERVVLRSPFEAFPWSTRSSRGLDLDHTEPWQPPPDGPPGQTRPDNLGPLTRRVHRAKTHGGWQLSQLLPGIFHWTSPHGYQYLVTPSHTLEIARPSPQASAMPRAA